MKEPYGEGLATHTDPESCGELREEGAEALTGARAGRVLSRERAQLRDADAVGGSGRQHRMHRYREMQTDLARSQTPGMYGNTLLENREILCPPGAAKSQAASGKSQGHTPTMYGYRKSDSSVVPKKFLNKAGQPVAEEMEGRGLAKGNLRQQNASRTQCRTDAPSELVQVRLAVAIALLHGRRHPRQEPDAVVPLVRIRGGGHGQP